MSFTVDDGPMLLSGRARPNRSSARKKNLDQVDFVHAEVIMQIAAERQAVSCFHKPVFIRNCGDDLLDRQFDFGPGYSRAAFRGSCVNSNKLHLSTFDLSPANSLEAYHVDAVFRINNALLR